MADLTTNLHPKTLPYSFRARQLRKSTDESFREQYRNKLRNKKTTYGKDYGNEERGFLPSIKTPESKSTSSTSTTPFPKTTMSVIGWQNHPLEIYGRYSRGKNSAERTLGWPREGI